VSDEVEREPRVVDSGPIVLIAESGAEPPPSDESDGN
jgi:hypothetical protein